MSRYYESMMPEDVRGWDQGRADYEQDQADMENKERAIERGPWLPGAVLIMPTTDKDKP